MLIKEGMTSTILLSLLLLSNTNNMENKKLRPVNKVEAKLCLVETNRMNGERSHEVASINPS